MSLREEKRYFIFFIVLFGDDDDLLLFHFLHCDVTLADEDCYSVLVDDLNGAMLVNPIRTGLFEHI